MQLMLRNLLCLMLVVAFAPTFAFADESSENGEALTLLRSGKTSLVTYSLYQIDRMKDDECDFLLILRNTGAKFIPMEHITSKHFRLEDARKRKVRFALREKPSGMAYGAVTVIHLNVWGENPAPPWTLHLTSDEFIVAVEMSVTDIRPVADDK